MPARGAGNAGAATGLVPPSCRVEVRVRSIRRAGARSAAVVSASASGSVRVSQVAFSYTREGDALMTDQETIRLTDSSPVAGDRGLVLELALANGDC